MGGIVDSIFGSKQKTKSSFEAVPVDFEEMRTPTFRVGNRKALQITPRDTAAPENPRLQDAFFRNRFQLNNQRGRLLGNVNRLRSNQNEFIDARVAPLEASLDRTLADAKRGLIRRGVSGTLANNELMRIRGEGERQIADQRALATEEALNAVLDQESAIRGVGQDEMSAAQSLVKDELSRLGISAEVLLGLLGSRRQTTQIVSDGQTTMNRESPARIIGSIMAAGAF